MMLQRDVTGVFATMIATATVALLGAAVLAETPSYDELSESIRRQLDHYAKDTYRHEGTIWRKDPQVWEHRALNSEPLPQVPVDTPEDDRRKKKRSAEPKPEYLPGSQWDGKAAPFEDGQLVAPVGYDLKAGRYIGAIPEDAASLSADEVEALRKKLSEAEAKEAMAKAKLDAAKAGATDDPIAAAKVSLLQSVYDAAKAEAEPLREQAAASIVTGRDLYDFILEHDVTLPDFYNVRLQHAPALYQQKVFENGGVRVARRVQVRPAIFKHEWRMRPHSISAHLNQLLKRQQRDQKLDAAKITEKEATLKKALTAATGDRRPIARKLMLFYLIDAEQPDKAANYTLDVDAPFRAGFKLATVPVADLDEIDALVLGDWAADLTADPALADYHTPLKSLAADAYRRYLKLNDVDDATSKRIRAALEKLDS